MSEHDSPAMSEAGKPGSGGKPSLFDRLRSLFGLGGASIRDDIEDALADTSLESDISPQERALLKNVLALDEVHVGDVMVPRADIAAVSLQATLGEVLAVFRTAGHSRLPVYGETLDDRSARHGAHPRFCGLPRRGRSHFSQGRERSLAASRQGIG